MALNTMSGVRVLESVYLTEAGKLYEVRRSWRERLFSRPWRPFKATRTVIPQVPMRGGYQLADGTLVLHPETLRQLKTAMPNGTPLFDAVGRATNDTSGGYTRDKSSSVFLNPRIMS